MTAVDHAELKRLAEGAISSLNSGLTVKQIEAAAVAFDVAANPAAVLALLSEIEGLKAERDVLEVERIGLRAAIFGSHDYDPTLRHASFIEMARLTEDARKGALSRALEAERQLADLRTQAPDSWRPDREAVDAALKLATEGADKAGCDGWRSQEKCRQIVQVLTKSLRPQTAESGK